MAAILNFFPTIFFFFFQHNKHDCAPLLNFMSKAISYQDSPHPPSPTHRAWSDKNTQGKKD